MQDQSKGQQRVVLVTGPSGAGRSTAINVLEDLGYEAIDNIPLSLIPRLLLDGGALTRPVALGVDIRNRDFSVQRLLELHRRLAAEPALDAQLLRDRVVATMRDWRFYFADGSHAALCETQPLYIRNADAGGDGAAQGG